MSVLFLSHSSADDGAAGELKRWLEGRGHRSLFLDFDPAAGIPAGRDWERELYRRLKACRALLVLCSESSMASKWCFVELAIARSLGKPIFPLLLEPCELPAQLSEVQVLDLAGDRERALERLVRGLAAAGVEATGELAWDGRRSPYPGLVAFERRDAAIFFGREREIGEAVELLNQCQRYGDSGLLMVLGASGSGKSSLLRAGVLPRLEADPERWLVVEPFRPREDPLGELAGALAATAERLGLETDWRSLRERLATGMTDGSAAAALDAILDELRQGSGRRSAQPLLAVDQFEELLGREAEHPAHGVLSLLRTMVERETPLLVVGTMRSDLLAGFQTEPALEGVRFANLSLGPLPAASLSRIIEGPAELAALELEAGLVPALLADMDTDDSLPLLAFTLSELYGRRRGDTLTLAAYRDELGGLKGSVARAADQVLAARAFTEPEFDDLRAAFLMMARLADGGRWARRSASWEAIAERLGGAERAHSLLDPFVEARLLVTRGDGAARSIEVAHEALLRSWTTLERWLDDNRIDLHLAAELARAAEEWRQEERSEDFLWRGSRLSRAVELEERGAVPLATAERAFVAAGAAAASRRARRRTMLTAAVVVIALAVAAVMGWQARREARARDLADRQVSRYLARQAGDHLRQALDVALLLGVRAYRTSPTFEAESVLLSALETTPRLLSYVPGERQTVQTIAFDTAGERVAFGGYAQTIQVWNLAAGRRDCELRLEGLKNWVSALVFAGDDLLISGSDDGRLRSWSVTRCALVTELGGHEGRVAGVALAGRGRVLSAGADGRLLLHDLEGGGAATLVETGAALEAVATSADGGLAAAGGLDGAVGLWDTASGELVDGWPRDHGGAVLVLALAPGGDVLVVGGGGDEPLRVWPLAAGAEPPPPPSHTGPVSSLAFARERGVLASGGRDGVIQVWDVGDPKRRLRLDAGAALEAVAFDPADPTRLVSASGDGGSVELWDVALVGDRNIRGLRSPRSLAFGPEGHRLAVVDDGTVRFLDPESGAPEGQPFPSSAAGEEVDAVAFSGDGRHLATGGDDGRVRLWDPVTREQWALPEPHDGAVTAVAFSADGTLVAAGGQDSTVRLWQVEGRQSVAVMTHDDWVNAVAFAPDSLRLASASDDGTVRVWSTASGELLATPLAPADDAGFPAAATAVAFDRSGVLAAAVDDGRVWLWDAGFTPLTGTPLEVAGRATAVAFDAAGETLAVGSAGGGVDLWELRSGGLRARARIDDDDGVSGLTFHPRRPLLGVVRSSVAELVDLSGIDSWAAHACRRANRDLTPEEWAAFIGVDVPKTPVCPGLSD